MNVFNELDLNISHLLIIVFLLLFVQFFLVAIHLPSKSKFWKDMVSKYKTTVRIGDDGTLKHFLYYLESPTDSEVAKLQFNGARYEFSKDGLFIRHPFFTMGIGESILLPWSKLTLGDRARIPASGWRFCEFRKIYVDDLLAVPVIPEEIAERIAKLKGL